MFCEQVEKTIPHPKYEAAKHYHDIALVKLKSPLRKFNDYMRPACLHTNSTIEKEFGNIPL